MVVATTMSFLSQLIAAFGGLQAVLVTALCVLVMVMLMRPKNLPPGPTGLPIVGNVFSLMTNATPVVYTEWSKKYGDVFTVYRGPMMSIVLNGYAAIHEALVKNADVFSSRHSSTASVPPAGIISGTGIVREPYGPKLKEHRKFALVSLRDFGVGKRSLEGKILEETRALQQEMCKHGGQGFCISQMLQNTVSNVICSIVFGRRYEYDDKKFTDLLMAIDRVFSPTSVERLALSFTVLRYIPGVRKGFLDLRKNQVTIVNHVKERIREHHETFDENDIRDFIDAFLLESKKRQEDENSTFTDEELTMIVLQLFLAGTHTTSVTLRWALLYMILHPAIQEKVQQEIDSVLGPDQDPSMVHRSQMPYTEATLAEVNRLASVAPFSVPHGTSSDTTFRGYNIPQDTFVEVNLWSVHHDPQLWPEPSKFDPARFLNDAGKFVKRNEVIAFSTGRRICLGEQLARMEIFIIFTSLLQRFSFKLPEGAPKPPEEGVLLGIHSPVPFKLIAEPRN
ncbi:cytochrome P450 2U1-like isoform X2 [Branchiostoma floridae x Branchiostoma belcheri]